MFCKECGAWLGEEEVQFCKECGADLGNGIPQENGINDVGKKIIKMVYETGKSTAEEIVNAAKVDVGKGLTKKGKKMTNTILKEVGLKPKSPIDVIKKKTKKTIKRLKKGK